MKVWSLAHAMENEIKLISDYASRQAYVKENHCSEDDFR